MDIEHLDTNNTAALSTEGRSTLFPMATVVKT